MKTRRKRHGYNYTINDVYGGWYETKSERDKELLKDIKFKLSYIPTYGKARMISISLIDEIKEWDD